MLYPSVVDPWLRYLSGAMDEEFVKWGDQPGSGYAGPGTWAIQLQELKDAEKAGKLFIGITHSSNGDEHAAVYGYATELLAGDGKAEFSMTGDYSGEPWFPEYNYKLGSPVGAYSEKSSGVYERKIPERSGRGEPEARGRVTVYFNAAYSGSGLSNARKRSSRRIQRSCWFVGVCRPPPASLAPAGRTGQASRAAVRHGQLRRDRRHRRHRRTATVAHCAARPPSPGQARVELRVTVLHHAHREPVCDQPTPASAPSGGEGVIVEQARWRPRARGAASSRRSPGPRSEQLAHASDVGRNNRRAGGKRLERCDRQALPSSTRTPVVRARDQLAGVIPRAGEPDRVLDPELGGSAREIARSRPVADDRNVVDGHESSTIAAAVEEPVVRFLRARRPTAATTGPLRFNSRS